MYRHETTSLQIIPVCLFLSLQMLHDRIKDSQEDDSGQRIALKNSSFEREGSETHPGSLTWTVNLE